MPPVDEPLSVEPVPIELPDDPVSVEGPVEPVPVALLLEPVPVALLDDPVSELGDVVVEPVPVLGEVVVEPVPVLGDVVVESVPVLGDVVVEPVLLPVAPDDVPLLSVLLDPVDGDPVVAPLVELPEVLPGVRPTRVSCDCVVPGVWVVVLPAFVPELVPPPAAPVPAACAQARLPIVMPTTAASAVFRNCFIEYSLRDCMDRNHLGPSKRLIEVRQAPCP